MDRPVYKIAACVEPRLLALSQEQRKAEMILPEFAERVEGVHNKKFRASGAGKPSSLASSTRLGPFKAEHLLRSSYKVRSISLMIPSRVRTANSACSSSIMSGGQSRSVVSPEPRTRSPL